MIPVQGFGGQTVAVLGLGRSGNAAVLALQEGGATVVVWDDGAAARDAAQAEGFTLRVPVADFFLANHHSLEGVGVVPDIQTSPEEAHDVILKRIRQGGAE